MSERFTLRINNELEGYDLIDEVKRIEHDGETEGTWVATIYEKTDADFIRKLMEDKLRF